MKEKSGNSPNAAQLLTGHIKEKQNGRSFFIGDNKIIRRNPRVNFKKKMGA